MNQIIKLTEISTPFVSNCILRNPFSFIILIETLFSDRGADQGGETCPLRWSVAAKILFYLLTLISER